MNEQRLIDANDIVKVADHAYNEWNLAMAAADGRREINLCFKRQDLCKAVRAVAENAPTIDPETLPIVKELREKLQRICATNSADYVAPVRHAHWVYNDGLDIECSACHADALANPASGLQVRSDYCHRCGAIMDEEVEDEC